jgi:hypothetical protein
MTPNQAEEALYNDLLSIYARAGAEVSYETDAGDKKAYWPKRFLQAVKRAKKNGELFPFVERLVQEGEPSRGFFILKKAERLDLTVEALVIDEEKPYKDRVEFATLEAARYRLRDHGYPYAFGKRPANASSKNDGDVKASSRGSVQLVPGASIDVRIIVGQDGELSLSLI